MYDAFLYVISNEGVDKQSSYAFRGKVRVLGVSNIQLPRMSPLHMQCLISCL